MTRNGELMYPQTTIGQRRYWLIDGQYVPVISGGSDEGEPDGGGLTVEEHLAPRPEEAPNGFISEAEFERRVNERIEAARREEKQKLYDEQKKLKDQVKDFERERKERAEAEEATRREAEEARRKAEEEEMSAKEIAERRHAEAMAEIDRLKAEREADRALMDKERELARIDTYRTRAVAAAIQEDRLPREFARFVRGYTEEEVDASIEEAIEAANETFSAFSSAWEQRYGPQEEGQPAPRRQPPPVFGSPPADPLGEGPEGRREQTFSVDDLRNMSMEDYARHRDSLLAASKNRYYQDRQG